MDKNDFVFDEEGDCYLVNSGHVSEAKGYEFVSSAYVSEEDFDEGKRVLYVEFRDGYLGDFKSDAVARDLDEKLAEMEGFEDIYWEDREFFHFTYKADQTDLKGLVKQIDKKVIELSKLY
ncbi:hypothetical protein HOK51_10975 [Candidatus Woesearchaeota archaeon]|nr:hypothetical protein [Candidatus Woesearchaeota archaeon]MBT6520344.1 hypothetical protein [Candidatus Woesearchaeota archaeon]MBT7368297.1 hypothetical protein [Candidatus Woesearchaeota archaeon]